MKASLWHERGLIVNRKLIRRIMREQGLSKIVEELESALEEFNAIVSSLDELSGRAVSSD